jgi:ubiquinone/menaquinone biosynthesis C-methylase UbiE
MAPARAEVKPAWLLDEVANAGRENLDVGHVSRYDSKEDADAPNEVTLCCQLGLTDESVVVEFGTGTGQFAMAVAPVCARVVAVDVSPPMLATLRDKVKRVQLNNVEVVRAGFLTYEHQGGAVDFVYSRYALHHLPDFWKGIALARVHRMLRPGGVFRLWDVVFNFDPADAEDRIESWCATGEPTIGTTPLDNGWARWEYEEHVRDEYSTFTWLLEPMIERSGFTIEAVEYSDDGIFARYVLRRA